MLLLPICAHGFVSLSYTVAKVASKVMSLLAGTPGGDDPMPEKKTSVAARIQERLANQAKPVPPCEYEADEGPASQEVIDEIRRQLPQDQDGKVLSSLLDDE